MKDYNIGKILYRAFLGQDTRIARNSYRVVEEVGGWEIHKCPTEQIGRMWIDSEGNKFTAWQLYMFIPTGEKNKFIRAYREHQEENGKEFYYL